MKKIYLKAALFLSVSLLFVSCGTTPKNEIAKDVQSPKVQTVKLTAEENDFLNNLKNINLSVESSPAESIAGKEFKGPFVIKIADAEGNAIADYKVDITCSNADYAFEKQTVSSDENGLITYSAPAPVSGINADLVFTPACTVESTKEVITNACAEKSVKALFKAKGNIANKGTILFVWDYNELGRPLNNSYDILSEIRSRGIYMAGNAPVSEISYFDKPLTEVYKQNRDIVGNMYGYLIVGQIKFVKPVEQVETEYLCSLIAEINVIDMSNGEVAFTNTFTNDALGSNWTKCVTKCKKELAGKIIDSIIYDIRL